ncbi:MAG: protein-glutamate O-methyltransferase [Kordiimonadaceae bacterium]|nr:protein-glutamate O-methyltransferase [Kordiimonadaceae bacterium]
MSMEDRQFKFRKSDFKLVRELVYSRTGISLSENKQEMVYSRLSRRIRTLEMQSFTQYLSFLESDAGEEEAGDFVNSMTTNLTRFFRESHHFDYLRNDVLKKRVEQARQHQRDKKIRIWSAGCSSGMEPYTIAMTVAATLPARENWDVQILATDIDTNMLNAGKAGRYRSRDCEGIPASLAERFVSDDGDHIEMADSLKRMISFKYMNFMVEWPVKTKFDVIFCRNVMIYFDKETQARIVGKFVNLLQTDGVLFVGHAEAMVANFANLRNVGRSSFRVDRREKECG